MSFANLPKFLFRSVLTQIASAVKKGESVQLVATPGAGGTLLAKILTQKPELAKQYFGDDYAFYLLDAGSLLERSAGALQNLFLSNSQVETICHTKKLVVIVDQLDGLNDPVLKPFFENLYSLYRSFEPKLTFIFRVTTPLTAVDQLTNFNQLGRLVSQNVIKLPPFTRDEAMWFMGEKKKRLSPAQKEKIYALSGGYPRTIKRLVESPSVEALALHLEELSAYRSILPTIPVLEAYLARKFRKTDQVGDLNLPQRLTRNEEKVLKILLTKKGEVVSRSEVIEKVWGEDGVNISDHAYDQLVHRLKNKLSGSTPKVILETVRGRGHCLVI